MKGTAKRKGTKKAKGKARRPRKVVVPPSLRAWSATSPPPAGLASA